MRTMSCAIATAGMRHRASSPAKKVFFTGIFTSVVRICRNRGAFSWRFIISTQGLGIRCAVQKKFPRKAFWLRCAFRPYG